MITGVPPQECVIVEDAEAGILAEKSGKTTTIGIGDAASCGAADFSVPNFSLGLYLVSKCL